MSVSPLTFEYDEKKARANLKKHGVSFLEAMTVFNDPQAATLPDEDHSEDESRLITIGLSEKHRVLYIVHTDRGAAIRLISARVTTTGEQRQYEED